MNQIKKVLMSIAALGALGLGGAAIADATSSGSTAKSDAPDTQIQGTDASRAGAAAVKAAGGGKVVSVEGTDEGGTAVYEVKVDNAGKITEVQLDKAFGVTAQKADDDKAESKDTGDGDGETNDDAAGQAKGQHDAGDGDGETQD